MTKAVGDSARKTQSVIRLPFLKTLDAFADFVLGCGRITPLLYLDPLAGLEIFVALKEMLDTVELLFGQVLVSLQIFIGCVQIVDANCQYLVIMSCLDYH